MVKDGRRTRCVDASLTHDERVCARARAWQVAPGLFMAGAVNGSAAADSAAAYPVAAGSAAADSAAADSAAHSAAPGSARTHRRRLSREYRHRHCPSREHGRRRCSWPVAEESSFGRASFRFGYQEAVEMRFVRGSFRERAPAVAWARLLVPLLPDVLPSSLQRAAALADFGSGISAVLDRSAWSYHNLDLSLHLHRHPADEWVCLESASVVGPEGAGTCRTTLHDAAGPFGVAAQSLLVTTIPGAALPSPALPGPEGPAAGRQAQNLSADQRAAKS